MPASTCTTPARLRGCLVGATTGALAVAAHGAAGGGYPSSAGAALLLLTALVAGAAAGSAADDAGHRRMWWPPARGSGVLIPLAIGQFAGHWALSGLTGHHTVDDGAPGALPAAAMGAAHLLAVAVCAIAIIVAERLYRSASSVLRALLAPPRPAPPTPRVRVAATAASAPHRAPNGASGPRAPPARADIDVTISFGEKAPNPCPTGFPPPCGAA
ncbi:hypothetical protein [Nocardia sp. NBC_00416]|uniref:hypothetical protein n=1 Tax=Nocardia sp. NBC_00416 TaxID=2975991 RepID=UPI002E1C68DF